jgi:AraC family transcriptional regulator
MDTGTDDRSAALDLWKRPGPVLVEFEKLTRGTVNHAAGRVHSGDAFRIVIGSGRDCMLQGLEMPAVLLPLRGRVKLTESDSTRIVGSGQLFLSEGGNRVQVVGSSDSVWVALVAHTRVWRRYVDAISESTIPAPVLLPATHVADGTVRRAVVHLARAARRQAASGEVEGAVLRFVALLLELQAEFDPLIERCPGRTLGQRRGVFLRLQRVCNHMEASGDLGIAGFARVANYSPCHFLRTFNSVYGRTPHAVLVEQRLKRALRLVHDTELSITEVAHASGFEDRCAFARSFKRRFGATATAVREQRLALASVCE